MEDKKVKEDLMRYYSDFSDNGKSTVVGYICESKLCDIMGWKQEDGNGYDAVTTESINIKVGNQTIKKTNHEIKIEIKTMTNISDTNQLSYDKDVKKDKYDYLAIYLYSENRLSLIPHDDIDTLVRTPGVGLTLNIKPGVRHNHKVPVYSELTKLFFKYEIKRYNIEHTLTNIESKANARVGNTQQQVANNVELNKGLSKTLSVGEEMV